MKITQSLAGTRSSRYIVAGLPVVARMKSIYTVDMNKFVRPLLGLVGVLSLILTSFLPLLSGGKSPQSSTAATLLVPLWTHEVAGPGELSSPVQLDGDGDPHIVTFDPAAESLVYLVRKDGVWSTEDIAPFPSDAATDDLAFDFMLDPSDGKPIVVFVDIEQNSLFFGRRNNDQWEIEPIAEGGRLLSLALGPDGKTHLALAREQAVVYMTQEGASWVSEIIDQGSYFWNLSLALDSQATPHVIYSGATGSYEAVRQNPHQWQRASLPFPNVETFALDDNDTPHLLITRAEPQGGRPPFALVTLSLAEQKSGQWNESPLYQDFDWSVVPDIVVDGLDRVNIAYHDATGRLHFQRREVDGSITHEIQRGGGWLVDMAVTAAPNPQPRLVHPVQGSLIFSAREEIWMDWQQYLPVTSSGTQAAIAR
jgi:hypothetical protein